MRGLAFRRQRARDRALRYLRWLFYSRPTDFYRLLLQVPEPQPGPDPEDRDANEDVVVAAIDQRALTLVRAEFEERT